MSNMYFKFILCFLFLSFYGCIAMDEKAEANVVDSENNIIWSLNTSGEIWSNPVVFDEIVYFGNDSGYMFAVDSNSGTVIWKYKTEGLVRCKAAIKDNQLLFVSDSGSLYSLNVKNGSLIWSTDIGANKRKSLPAQSEYSYDYRQSSPIIYNDKVYVGSSNSYLYSINLSDGSIDWSYDGKSMIRSTPIIENDTLYVGTWRGIILAIDINSGEMLWEFKAGGIVNSDFSIINNKLIIGSRDAKIYALDSTSGEAIWTYRFSDRSWVDSSPIVHNNNIYIGSSDSMKLLSLAENGTLNWEYNTGGWSWGTPVINKNSIYIGSIYAPQYTYFPQTTMALHSVDLLTGNKNWIFEPKAQSGFIKGGVLSTPVLIDDTIFFGSIDGTFYAIKDL